VDEQTVGIYERRAAEWAERRPPRRRRRAAALGSAALPGRPRADLGCGPGAYVGDLGEPVVAVDAARAMLVLARERAPSALPVQADLEALPLRPGVLGAAWARNSYLHVPATRLPLALAGLQRAMAVGAPATLSFLEGDGEGPLGEDDFPGRFFSLWRAGRLGDVVEGAGFDGITIESVAVGRATSERGDRTLWVSACRARTLPDTVGPGMRLLVCGLNPSLVAADAGYGYAGRSNRFWTAAVSAGLVSRRGDPWHALSGHGVGITDLVKRATPGIDDLTREEYRRGAERVARLVEWLRPRAVLFVGLAGWREAVDRRAVPGPQPRAFGGAPAYCMPSTSGRNARTPVAELVRHLQAAAALAE
jgi:TDG/mug DNA glycosylase family protein